MVTFSAVFKRYICSPAVTVTNISSEIEIVQKHCDSTEVCCAGFDHYSCGNMFQAGASSNLKLHIIKNSATSKSNTDLTLREVGELTLLFAGYLSSPVAHDGHF